MSIAGQLWVWLSGASWGQAELNPSRCRRSTSLEARARTHVETAGPPARREAEGNRGRRMWPSLPMPALPSFS